MWATRSDLISEKTATGFYETRIAYGYSGDGLLPGQMVRSRAVRVKDVEEAPKRGVPRRPGRASRRVSCTHLGKFLDVAVGKFPMLSQVPRAHGGSVGPTDLLASGEGAVLGQIPLTEFGMFNHMAVCELLVLLHVAKDQALMLSKIAVRNVRIC